MRADNWSHLDPNGPGRNSVRIRSNKTYTTHVVVLDARHMPQGCGTWPSFWTTAEDNWPNDGEVDIIEGVNDQSDNQITLHTAAGCTMPSGTSPMTGSQGSLDCEGNEGCGISATGTANSYGPSFNQNGGGFYAMERNNNFIKVWFWPRQGDVPSDVLNSAKTVDTDAWGTPVAFFPNTQCNLQQFFAAHNIIINLTLCGDWAGAVYGSSGCPSTCTDFVNNNPDGFNDAFWDIGSVRVYENPVTVTAHQIHPNGDTSKCLDVQEANFSSGTLVQIANCTGNAAQQWYVNVNSDTTTIQVANTNFCLDASDSPSSGTQMKIWECTAGLAAQTWSYTSDNRIALQSGQCLDDPFGTDRDGLVTQIWECTDDDSNQVWTLS
ncbi:hypothetical protein EIP86_005327 [Pleurotus ostreatoroseus]|nr:hypothetical protein EIP86_005327 [Pleurotus ostreatoroseus]